MDIPSLSSVALRAVIFLSFLESASELQKGVACRLVSERPAARALPRDHDPGTMSIDSGPYCGWLGLVWIEWRIELVSVSELKELRSMSRTKATP